MKCSQWKMTRYSRTRNPHWTTSWPSRVCSTTTSNHGSTRSSTRCSSRPRARSRRKRNSHASTRMCGRLGCCCLTSSRKGWCLRSTRHHCRKTLPTLKSSAGCNLKLLKIQRHTHSSKKCSVTFWRSRRDLIYESLRIGLKKPVSLLVN